MDWRPTHRMVKSLSGQMLFASRLHRLLLDDAAVVVTFHRVNNTVEDGLTCDVETFTRYCSFFASYFRVVPLAGLVKKLESGEPVGRELAITFDDGYSDNYDYAAPILKTMSLPATFFVVSRFIGTDVVSWWDKDLSVRPSWMSWDQVISLHREGFEVGSHTCSHVDLGNVSAEEARREILESRAELEQRLAAPVTLFAYPYGDVSRMTPERRALVKAAGFQCCCSCFGGLNATGTDPFQLRRVPVSSWYGSPYHFGFDVIARRTGVGEPAGARGRKTASTL
jgi:peptidoglycan/xylan/chitin deacetylase (PgdA/CDA1 family)